MYKMVVMAEMIDKVENRKCTGHNEHNVHNDHHAFNLRINAAPICLILMILVQISSSFLANSNLTESSSCVSNSDRDPSAMKRKFVNSLGECLAAPSAMFEEAGGREQGAGIFDHATFTMHHAVYR